jgi:hypothetical protein
MTDFPTYERDTGGHRHEWSIPSATSNPESTVKPQHFRVFVSIDPELSTIITVEDAQVTSEQPAARRIEGTSRSVSLTMEEFRWLIEKGPQILTLLQERWDAISAELNPAKTVVELGIDGNCGYALVGEDLATGEAVFVRIKGTALTDRKTAVRTAYETICRRFKQRLPYRFDDSYPSEGGARDLERDESGS